MKHTARNEVTMPTQDQVMWTPKEVAKHFRVHVNYIYALLNAGRLQYVGPRRRPGSRRPYLIHVTEVHRIEREGLPEAPRGAA
ncbi:MULTISPECIES: helix-turn-helix domain-containing protein [Corynebacterium]|uniref:helix-turn-helix domain-containing protein n=1 Tax=Corynebacterium TaxID=1716 RepID=UPI000AA6E08A|nr:MULTISPECIES: helix-turn-helix domain-containing protein [Corynebacterium]